MAAGKRGELGLQVSLENADRIKELIARADAELYGPPLRDFMERVRDLAYNLTAAEAPIGASGQTVSRLYQRMDNRPVPLWVRVGTRATRRSAAYPRGYPYPKRVAYDLASPHYGWMERVKSRTGELAKRLTDPLIRELESRWEART